MESILSLGFFGLLALAAVVSIVNSFNEDRYQRNPYDRQRRNTYDRYDDDPYGRQTPVVIYQQPQGSYDRYYGGNNRQQPFWSNILVFAVVIGGLVYYFSVNNVGNINSNTEVVQMPTDTTAVMQLLPPPPKVDITPTQGYSGGTKSTRFVNPHSGKWIVIASIFSSPTASEQAMYQISEKVPLGGATIYTGLTNKGRFMVYIPVSSAAEAQALVAQLKAYHEQIKAFAPDEPTFIFTE